MAPITWRFQALTVWPGVPTPRARRKRAPFKATFERTRAHLQRELLHLGARDVVIEADCEPSEIRQDGFFRASARMRGPGVIITYTAKGHVYRYPCDKFSEWQDNVRAISLTLERLRAVDRYGVTLASQQYQGFRKLEAASTSRAPEPLSVLATFSGIDLATLRREPGAPLRAFRIARARTHTDVGGARADWDRVEAAARSLGLL